MIWGFYRYIWGCENKAAQPYGITLTYPAYPLSGQLGLQRVKVAV